MSMMPTVIGTMFIMLTAICGALSTLFEAFIGASPILVPVNNINPYQHSTHCMGLDACRSVLIHVMRLVVWHEYDGFECGGWWDGCRTRGRNEGFYIVPSDITDIRRASCDQAPMIRNLVDQEMAGEGRRKTSRSLERRTQIVERPYMINFNFNFLFGLCLSCTSGSTFEGIIRTGVSIVVA